MHRWFAGGLAAAAAGLMAFSAAAQDAGNAGGAEAERDAGNTFPEKPPMLEYVVTGRAKACPDEEEFRIEVAVARQGRREKEFLPFDVHDQESGRARLTLDVLPNGKFVGTLEHFPPPGMPARDKRVMVNSECDDLIRDLAFPASLMLPFLKPLCPGPKVCPAPAPPSPPPPVSTAPPAEAAAPPVGRPECDRDKPLGDPENDRLCRELMRWLKARYDRPVNEFWLFGGGLMSLVFTSDPGPGISLGLEYRRSFWSVAVEAQSTLPAPVRVGPGNDADVSSFMGLLVPCVRFGEMVRFVGCGVVGGGAFLSYDSQHPEELWTESYYIRMGPRAGIEVALGDRLGLFASGELGFSPTPILLFYEPDGGEWTTSVVSVFLSAGVSVRLND